MIRGNLDPIDVAILVHTRPLTPTEEYEDAAAEHKRQLDACEEPGVCAECNAQGCPTCFWTGLIPQTLKQTEKQELLALVTELSAIVQKHRQEWDHDFDIAHDLDAITTGITCLEAHARALDAEASRV
jgi:hypothetical protein